MFVIERPVVWRMRLIKSNEQDKRLVAMALEKIVGFEFEKSRLRKFKGKRANKWTTEGLSFVGLRLITFAEKKFCVIAFWRVFFSAAGAFRIFLGRRPFLKAALRKRFIAQMPFAEVTGFVIRIGKHLRQTKKIARQCFLVPGATGLMRPI